MKSCLERKMVTISKVDAEISENVDDENEIVHEIENSEELQKDTSREVLRKEKFIKQVKAEAETE